MKPRAFRDGFPGTSAGTKTSPLARHRERQHREGLRRVEVLVREEDAQSIRDVAAALADPKRAAAAREFKAWLEACPPLDDLELTRRRDLPRDIEF